MTFFSQTPKVVINWSNRRPDGLVWAHSDVVHRLQVHCILYSVRTSAMDLRYVWILRSISSCISGSNIYLDKKNAPRSKRQTYYILSRYVFWMILGIYEGRDFSVYNLLILCAAKTRLARWHLKHVVVFCGKEALVLEVRNVPWQQILKRPMRPILKRYPWTACTIIWIKCHTPIFTTMDFP